MSSLFSDLIFETGNNDNHFQIVCDFLKKSTLNKNFRILDLGCGTGQNIIQIANLYDQSECIGIDISKKNIEKAKNKILDKKLFQNITFYENDYMETNFQPFDIIYSNSVLHFIKASDSALCKKLSDDLKPRGLLIITMPYDCLYNRFIIQLRKFLKICRCKILDNLIIQIANVIYSVEPENLLAERLPYMYLIPERIYSKHFQRTVLLNKLMNKEYQKLSSKSVAKLKHRLYFFQKID